MAWRFNGRELILPGAGDASLFSGSGTSPEEEMGNPPWVAILLPGKTMDGGARDCNHVPSETCSHLQVHTLSFLAPEADLTALSPQSVASCICLPGLPKMNLNLLLSGFS